MGLSNLPKVSEQISDEDKIWLQGYVLKPAPSHLLGEMEVLIGSDEISPWLADTCRQWAARQHRRCSDRTPAAGCGRMNQLLPRT